MSYAIYLRKSRADAEAEAHGEGETLARHRATLLELSARRNLPIGQIYEEIVSGDTIAARPEMQGLLHDVELGLWQGVLVVEVERLARGDSVDQGIVAQTFKYSNTVIVTPTKTYDPTNDMDEEYFEFGLFMARREYKAIKRRLLAGRMASVREGKYMGTRPVFGYRRVKLKGQKGWSLEIVPDEADAVRMMYDLYLHGEGGHSVGANEIANRLNAMGFRTYGGHAWSADRVRNVLVNPDYIGKVQWNQRITTTSMQDGVRVTHRPRCPEALLVTGLHEPIIDDATWQGVQEIFSARKKPPVHDGLVQKNPLNGLIKCAICERAIVMTPLYNYQAGKTGYKCSQSRCPASSVQSQYVIELVMDTLQNWATIAAQPADDKAIAADPTARIRQRLDKQVATLQAQRSHLHDLLEQGVYDVSTFVDRNTQLQARIDAAQQELSKLATPYPTKIECIRALGSQIKHVIDTFDSAGSPADQCKLLQTVVQRIYYHKTHRCRRNENPLDHLSIEMFPVGMHPDTVRPTLHLVD